MATPEATPLRALAPWLIAAIVVAALDQLTKQLVLANLDYGQAIPVTSFFDLVLVYNPGAAFSFLAEHSGWQRWFFTALAVVICGWLLRLMYQHRAEKLLPLAFAMIIGGAVGNVIDRLIHSAVVDFLYFHAGRYGWPAFNLADSAITVGVVLMLWGQFRHDRRNAPDPTAENPS
ncbi:lipoprotein signal peptidase [Azoarcus sp. TTM-91]|nr:lipoprotein signal peptidase [Azoarcus sp. TTM-91]